MLPLEAWERVYVNEDFLGSLHGKLKCIDCHEGDPKSSEKDKAHLNLVAYPGDDAKTYCGGCHGSTVANHGQSLHANLQGYYKRIENRLGYSIKNNADVMTEFDKECGKCHASCGQCHVQRPISVGSGLMAGHQFRKTPSMVDNCTACHGSRVGAEYLGENEGYKADVHWLPNAKRCEFCHTGQQIHGTGQSLGYRYDNLDRPRCEGCHEKSKDGKDMNTANLYHSMHLASATVPKLACQVCHSQEYKNCNGCHTGGAGITGSSYLKFKIAKNYLKSPDRPYDYICVRHIPIAPDTYASWGIASLPNYSAEPTWKYATPHNISRWTSRTQVEQGKGCTANCHKSDYYLTSKDLFDYEVDANKNIIMN
ncbi:hypothetical protein JW964_02290 [candidate division KSB1 bacterium]|nr:hypothetical protein [candidate division KSB1 bacterium]